MPYHRVKQCVLLTDTIKTLGTELALLFIFGGGKLRHRKVKRLIKARSCSCTYGHADISVATQLDF